MSWKETCPMDQKVNLIADLKSREFTITELAEMYSVSRKTIYKWASRYEQESARGLEDRSRAPHTHWNATPPELVDEIVMLKTARRAWGPRKILAKLEGLYPDRPWPAASTASEILRRKGLVRPRPHRRHSPPYTEPFVHSDRPNKVWCADYKGQFRLGDKSLCYPLTITDSYSRYLLGCWGLGRPTYDMTWPLFQRAFREYGLPEAIRTDNGVPFASTGLGGLSRLSVWLVKLGIRPERIEPGHPEQNGRHERFHRTLKESAISPPRKSLAEQQRAFHRFSREYNFERPHEALLQKTPAMFYQPSERPYPTKIRTPEYPTGFLVKRVKHNGEIKWKGHTLYVSGALAGEFVGLKPVDDYFCHLYFSFHPLGVIDNKSGIIVPMP